MPCAGVEALQHYLECVIWVKVKRVLDHECATCVYKHTVCVKPLTCELFDLCRWVSFCEAHSASSGHLFVHMMS